MFTFTPREIECEDEWCHYVWQKYQFVMLYLALDKEIKISLFFFATFLYENEAPYLKQAAVVTMATRVLQPLKRHFCASPWVPNCMHNLKGGWKFGFPKVFDSYRDLLLKSCRNFSVVQGSWSRAGKLNSCMKLVYL